MKKRLATVFLFEKPLTLLALTPAKVGENATK